MRLVHPENLRAQIHSINPNTRDIRSAEIPNNHQMSLAARIFRESRIISHADTLEISPKSRFGHENCNDSVLKTRADP